MEKGIYLEFVVITNTEGHNVSYDLMFYNNFDQSFNLKASLFLGGELFAEADMSLYPQDAVNFVSLDNDALNDGPRFELKFESTHDSIKQRLTFEKQLKIKAKAFFTRKSYFEPMSCDSMSYIVMEKIPELKIEEVKKLKEIKTVGNKNSAFMDLHNIIRKAELSSEIDLHLEKLTPDHADLKQHEKLDFQLGAALKFLDESRMHDVREVYLIHGVGKGRLKNALAEMLETYPDIDSFHNEFHPKYAFGATTVRFK